MNYQAATDSRPGRRNQDAFTFTELLVVLCVLAVLALLAVTAMAHSQPSSDRAGCANNLRRLMQAWQMYADDYSGQLMGSYSGSPGLRTWVSGYLDYSSANSDNTNTAKLADPAFAQIGPYVNSSSLFRCPADPTALVVDGEPMLRVRSYSMNAFAGPNSDPINPTFQVMGKMAEVSRPDRIFVLLEEHPGSLNDSVFLLDLVRTGSGTLIIDYPGHFHLGGANLGMADGHVEHWQWSDARTMPPMNGTQLALNVVSPNNPDVARLQAAGSYQK